MGEGERGSGGGAAAVPAPAPPCETKKDWTVYAPTCGTLVAFTSGAVSKREGMIFDEILVVVWCVHALDLSFSFAPSIRGKDCMVYEIYPPPPLSPPLPLSLQENLHGVRQIQSGVRHVLALWFTHKPERREVAWESGYHDPTLKGLQGVADKAGY